MRVARLLTLLALPAAAFAQAPQAPPAASVDPLAALPPEQAALRAHVLFLAADAMKGREAGSAEYDIAAQYVAAQFSAAGLRPMGDGGSYLQRVPMLSYKAASEGSLSWMPKGGVAQPLVFGTDYVPVANARAAETAVSGPVVFVGYGISAPQFGYDDYKGVDVRGKIVAFVTGTPQLGNSEVNASLTTDFRLLEAQRRGAVGAVAIGDVASGRVPPFDRIKGRWQQSDMTWATPSGVGGGASARGVPVLALLSRTGAAKVFGAGWAAIEAAGGQPKPAFKPVAADGTLSARTRTAFTPALSSNVIGVIPGSDPKVGPEVVVLSAHLDHIGVSPETADGKPGADRINNGALDNAVGIGSLIEEAKRFAASGQAPKRTIMFLAVTGEEKGLVGSDYFSNHPTVPIGRIVADVNLDMPVLFYRFTDVVAFGADRSGLGPIVRKAAAGIGVGLAADQTPEQALFVRSDHFRFVQKGVPSVFLWPGPGNGGKEALTTFLTGCYHHPCDDLTQPIQWDQGVRFVEVNYRIAREIADGAEAPRWNKGDYFGTLYKGPMAR